MKSSQMLWISLRFKDPFWLGSFSLRLIYSRRARVVSIPHLMARYCLQDNFETLPWAMATAVVLLVCDRCVARTSCSVTGSSSEMLTCIFA